MGADRKRIRDAGSAFSHIADQYQKARAEKEKLRFKIQKEAILQRMRSEQSMDNFKAREDYKQKLKANDPAQTFLKNRFQSEKPLDRTVLPTDDRPEAEFPADEVVQGKTGKLELKPLDENRKSQLFLKRLEDAQTAFEAGKGKAPSALAVKIGEKMRERLNRKLGYKQDPEDTGVAGYSPKKKAQGPNTATQKALKKLSEMALEKTLTQKEAFEELSANEEAYALAGVDVGYIQKQISSILPEEKRSGKKGFFGMGSKPEMKKKGGVWYKKVDNSWELTDSPED